MLYQDHGLGTSAAAVMTALMRKPSDPAKLGIAAVIVGVIVHLAMFFTLCGLMMKKRTQKGWTPKGRLMAWIRGIGSALKD